MDINTAYRGEPHLSAENAADLNRGIVGPESYVLPVGMQFEAELVTNNLIKIRDGCGCMQGRQVSIGKGLSDEITVENGTQGEKRIDLIVIRYEKDTSTGIESAITILIKGDPSVDVPITPEHVQGDIRAGDTVADWPMYEVELDGISVVGVRPLFNLLYNADEIKQKLDSLNSKLSADYIVERGSGYTKWESGILEMWGTATSGSNSLAVVTFPVPFASKSYIMYATPIYYSSSYNVFICSVQPSSNSQGGIYTRQHNGSTLSGVSCSWRAIGRWK